MIPRENELQPSLTNRNSIRLLTLSDEDYGVWLRRRSDRLLRPAVRVLSQLGISPNALTGMGFVLTWLSALLIIEPSFRIGGVCIYLAAGLCDTLDGALARSTKQRSTLGEYLDSVLDQYGDFAIYLSIFWVSLQSDNKLALSFVFFALMGSLLTAYSKLRADLIGVKVHIGILTRFERVAVIYLALLTGYTILGLGVIAVLSNLTAIHRILYTIQAIRYRNVKNTKP